MSIELFKMTLKKNLVLLLIFFGVLTMYLAIMISMFNPDEMEALTSMLELFPPDVASAMGFSQAITDITGYLASWLYGLLMLGFPMVYCILLGNKLVSKMVDNGSFAYLLSTPNSRTKIIATQGVYAIISVFILFFALFAAGTISSQLLFPDLLDVAAFFKLNVTTMLVNMVVMMISFFFSCVFNEAKLATGLGAGVPIAFLLLKMLGGASADAKVLQKLSIYGWYDPVELVRGQNMTVINLVYVCLIFVLFAAAILIFKKKRLPL